MRLENADVAKMENASDLGSDGHHCKFESCHPHYHK